MDDGREQIPQHILQDIRRNFKFMFDRGYEIVSTHYFSGYYDGYWEVVFGSPDFSLKIVNDQGLSLSFGSSSKGYMNVEALIHYLSGQDDYHLFPFILGGFRLFDWGSSLCYTLESCL